MVWSQYVYEATHGYDAYSSDENEQDGGGSSSRLTIHDFQDAYAYELYDVFGVIETLIRDAYLEHDIKPDFNEFVELCFYQFDEDDDEDVLEEEFEHVDHARTTGKSVAFADGKTSRAAVMFHALVFFAVYGLIAKALGITLTKTDLIVTTTLFILLNPGVLLTLPPKTKAGSLAPALTHAVVYAVVFALLRKQFPQYY